MDGKIFIIMGKSATGKDTVYERVLKLLPDLKPVIPYTTRPIREGEVDGQAYHFVTEDGLAQMESEGLVIEKRVYHTVHGDWYYFTADDMDREEKSRGDKRDIYDLGEDAKERDQADHIMITTLEGYEKIRDHFGEDSVVPIYIEVDDITRIERALAREKHEEQPCVAEVCRRFLADDEDFSEDKLARVGIKNRIVNDDLEQAVSEVCEYVTGKKEVPAS